MLLRLATRVGAAFGLRDFFESFQISRAYQIKNKPTRMPAASKMRTKRFVEEFDAAGFEAKVCMGVGAAEVLGDEIEGGPLNKNVNEPVSGASVALSSV